MKPLELLLILQNHDTHLEQIRHKRENLQERSELESWRSQEEDLRGRLAAVSEQKNALDGRQRRCEVEIEALQSKREEEKRLLYSNRVTGLREIQSLEQEISALGRRQEVVEDKLLLLLEDMDPLKEEIDSLEKQLAKCLQRIEDKRSDLAQKEEDLDAQAEEVLQQREGHASEVPENLLVLYEGFRVRFGGIAVAKLSGGTCTGCHLSLPLMEVDKLRKLPPYGEAEPGQPDQSKAACPFCERLLVI